MAATRSALAVALSLDSRAAFSIWAMAVLACWVAAAWICAPRLIWSIATRISPAAPDSSCTVADSSSAAAAASCAASAPPVPAGQHLDHLGQESDATWLCSRDCPCCCTAR
jgi:hypothetical protein